MVAPLFMEDTEVMGDLYLDVAEAYTDNGEAIFTLVMVDW